MKVLHINWQIWGPHFKGGHVIHVETLLQGLSSFPEIKQGYLFSSPAKSNGQLHVTTSNRPGLDVFEINNSSINSFFDLPQTDLSNPAVEEVVANILTDFAPDVVHVHHLIQFPLAILDLIRYRFNIPVVVTIRDYWYVCKACILRRENGTLCQVDNNCYFCGDCISAKSRTPLESVSVQTSHGEFLLRKYRYLRELGACEKITFVSEFLRMKYALLGLCGGNAVALTAGVPFQQPKADKSFNKVRNVALLGYFSNFKGGHFVLHSLGKWQKAPFNLHIWGKIEDLAFIERIKEDLPRVNIFINGTYERQDMEQILATVDIGIVPSLWPDTAPQVVMDFFSFKIPVLGSRIGGLPEFISHDHNGLLFEPGNTNSFLSCLEQLIEDNGTLERLSKNITPTKSIASYAQEIFETYRDCVLTSTSKSNKEDSIAVDLTSEAGFADLFSLSTRLKEIYRKIQTGCHVDVTVSLPQRSTDRFVGSIKNFVCDSFANTGFKDICQLPEHVEPSSTILAMRARKNIKVAVFALGDKTVASSRVRMYNVLPRLEQVGYTVDFMTSYDYCDDHDIIVIQKRWDDFFLTLKKPLIVDIDDNYFQHGTDCQSVINFAQRAAAVVVSTEHLSEIARQYNNNVHIIPTGLDVHEISEKPKKAVGARSKQLVWVGYPENVNYLEKLLPLIKKRSFSLRLITRNTPAVQRIISQGDGLVEFFDWSLATVDHLIAECDIGIAPLEADSWACAKSGYKVLKYLSLGLKVVCDPSAEYQQIENKLETKVIANSIAEWEALLDSDEKYDQAYIRGFLLGFTQEATMQWREVLEQLHGSNEQPKLVIERGELLKERTKTLLAQTRIVEDQRDMLIKKEQKLVERDQLLNELKTAISRLESTSIDQAARLKRADEQILHLNNQLTDILSSASWRVTQPARTLVNIFKHKK